MFEYFKFLFGVGKTNFFKIWFVFFIVCLSVTSFIELYLFVGNELQRIADKSKIHIVLENKTKEIHILDLIKNLKSDERIKRVVYISPKQAEEEFFENYTTFSKDLLTVNPFPPIVQFSVKKSYFDSDNISKIIDDYINNEYIEEVRFKKEFLDSYSLIKKHFFNFIYFFSILFLLILVMFEVSFSRNIIKSFKKNGIESSSGLVSISIIAILLSLFITSIGMFIIWMSMKSMILWLNLISIKSLISISTFTAIGVFAIMLLIILFQKDGSESE